MCGNRKLSKVFLEGWMYFKHCPLWNGAFSKFCEKFSIVVGADVA